MVAYSKVTVNSAFAHQVVKNACIGAENHSKIPGRKFMISDRKLPPALKTEVHSAHITPGSKCHPNQPYPVRLDIYPNIFTQCYIRYNQYLDQEYKPTRS